MKHSRLLVGAAVSAVLVGSGLTTTAAAATPAGTPNLAAPLTRAAGPAATTPLRLRAAAAAPAPIRQLTVPHLSTELNAVAGVGGAASRTLPEVGLTRTGAVEVTVRGTAALAAASAVGARVLAHSGDAVTVTVAPSKLRALAAQPGVSRVAKPQRPVLLDITSQGVVSSGAKNWADQNPSLGKGGAGVKIGIVDEGFADLAAEKAAGNLPQTVVYPSGQNHCANDQQTGHGTAVAEIAHQMAPQATIYLYCIEDPTGFAQAADQVIASGVPVVNSSLGFTAESAGDGTGTTEVAVTKARNNGVLWVQSAGNSAQDHWSGTLTDADNDQYIDINGTGDSNEVDNVYLDPRTSGSVVLAWNQWPTSTLALELRIDEYDADGNPVGDPQIIPRDPSDPSPTLGVDITNESTTVGDVHTYSIGVTYADGTTLPASTHYDLYYLGDFYESYLAYHHPAQAAAGSVLQPASAPKALAVGAVDWRSNTLEPFSSRGPTITGAVKPEILGFDGVSSNIDEVESDPSGSDPLGAYAGFYGTSSAAPHVAGAAALVLAQNPTFTADQLQSYLMSHSSPKIAGGGILQLADLTTKCAARGGAPAKLAVTAAVTTFSSALTTTCTNYSALATFSGPSGIVDYLNYRTGAATQPAHFTAATDPVGTYTIRGNGGVADQGGITWTTSSSVIVKYASYTYVASSRQGKVVYINGFVKAFGTGGLGHGVGRSVYLQRYLNGAWQTMLMRPTDANARMAVGFIQTTVYQYRLVTTETTPSFGSNSVSAFR